MQEKRNRVTRRTWLGIAVATALIALTVALSKLLGDTKYYIASVLIVFFSCIPFFMRFESRRPQARELVTIAVLTALAAVSRVAFVAVPHFKPIIGMIFIAGMGMGAGGGFMVGSLSAMASNLVFGQGPWTPWQMFAYGMAGFVAGLLREGGLVRGDRRLPAAIWSAVVTLLLVGPILDTCALFLMTSAASSGTAAAIYLSGLPVNAVLAAATFLTVLLLGKPMLEKLERIKMKYGMMDEDAS